MLAEEDLEGGALERWLTREHLVEHTAEAVDVAPGIDIAVAGGLLGAHVGGRAEAQSGFGQLGEVPRPGCLALASRKRPRDTEVGHDRMTRLEQDVLGLDIAMNHALAVGIVERVGDLTSDAEGVVERELRLAFEAGAERLAVDERHDVEEERPLRSARISGAAVIKRKDMGMVQARRDLDFAEEAIGAERRGELGAEDLHRNLAMMLQVFREIDGGHAAHAELTQQPVAVGERGGERRRNVGGIGRDTHAAKMTRRDAGRHGATGLTLGMRMRLA